MDNVLPKNNVAGLEAYFACGGYKPLKKALALGPARLREEITKAGLKWPSIPAGAPEARYLVCNAGEGEPGTFKDRELLRRNPHALIEGMAIAACAIGAAHGYIYIRGEFAAETALMNKAAADARAKGFIGRNILGSGFDLELFIHRGAGACIRGEATALLESLEGHKGQPRLKPHFPEPERLFGGPALVDNIETLAALPSIIEKGGDWHAAQGTGLFCVSGPVCRPGVYELPAGTEFSELLEARCGGLKPGKKLKAVLPGGASAPVLTAAEAMAVTLGRGAPAAAGPLPGPGGVIMIDDGQCMVKLLQVLARFYRRQSCGRCAPCREGCGWLETILDRLEAGGGAAGDVDLLYSVAEGMTGRTLCGLAGAMAVPAMSFVKKFRAEFEAHAAGKVCGG